MIQERKENLITLIKRKLKWEKIEIQYPRKENTSEKKSYYQGFIQDKQDKNTLLDLLNKSYPDINVGELICISI